MHKEWKQKIPFKRFVHFLTMITKKNWIDRGTEFAGAFKKLCKADGIQIYSTMSGTKTAFAERTIRSLTQFVTTLNSRRNCSIDLIPKNVSNSDFLSILYSKPLRVYRKPKFKIGERVRTSKYDWPFRKGYKPQFIREVFEIVAISSRKSATYTLKDEQDEIIRGKFYQKALIKVISNWNRSQQSWFQMHLRNCF